MNKDGNDNLHTDEIDSVKSEGNDEVKTDLPKSQDVDQMVNDASPDHLTFEPDAETDSTDLESGDSSHPVTTGKKVPPESPSPPKISPYSETIAVLLFYFILLLVIFRPLFLNFNDLIFQARGDDFFFWQWRAWMSGELFTTFLKAKPFHLFNLLYYGVFANSGYPEVGNVFDLLFISYPLSKLISFPAFHNVKCILFMLFNGWAAYFAISRLTKNYGAAVVCGIFIIFNPHTMMMINISRLRASMLGFMILFIYYFYMFYIKPTWKNAILSGIFLAISSLFYWFHGIFLVWTAVAMVIVKIFTIMRKSGKKNKSSYEPDNLKKRVAGRPLPPAEDVNTSTEDSLLQSSRTASAPGGDANESLTQGAENLCCPVDGSDLLRNGEKQETADNVTTQGAGAPCYPIDGTSSLQIGNKNRKESDNNSLFPFLIKTVLIFAILAAVFIPFYLPYAKQTVSMQMDDVKFFIKFPPLQEGLRQHQEFLNKDGFPWMAVRLILTDSSTLKFHFSFLFMLAALFAFKGKRKFAFFLLAVFIFFSLLSYGPFLKLSAKQDLGEFAMQNGNPIPMPYKFFFENIPPTARLQHPNRFLSMSAIALMFLGGMGLSALFDLLRKTTFLKYLPFLLATGGMLITVPSRTPDLYLPSISSITVPRIYNELGKDNEQYGIIEFPYHNNLDRISFYQTFHHKKSPGTLSVNLYNNLRELPDSPLKYISGSVNEFEQSNFNRFIKESAQGKETELTVEDLREMKAMGYHYVILHEWDFPFEGEETDMNAGKRKQSYLRTGQKLEEIAGKPERYWEVRHRFVLQDIPVETWIEAFEISVFRLDNI